MVSDVERSISVLMRSNLSKIECGSDIFDSELISKLLSLLETFITLEIRKRYQDWKYESLDGIFTEKISKTDKNQFCFVGMSILTIDQSLIPIFVHIKISDSQDRFDWVELKLAEHGENGIIKIPYNSNRWRKKLYILDSKSINWYYSVKL